MNYLVIATKTNDVWTASILKDTEPTFEFAMNSFMNSNATKLDTSNITIASAGYITFTGSDYELNNNYVRDIVRTHIGFRVCDECGAFITPQDIRNNVSTWDGNKRLCKTCLDRHEQEQAGNRHIALSRYHGTEGNVRVINAEGEEFTLENVKGIGIEMEANASTRIARNGEIKATEEFYRIANSRSRNRIFRCEEDCTVQAEFISNVFTKKSFEAFDWNILANQLKHMGNDESVANVGFHVHLSKLWLGDDAKTQVLNFLKLQYFIKSYEADFLKLSGRKVNEMRYCGFFSHDDIARMKRDILNMREGADVWRDMPSSHCGSACLISSGATIELRIGKSTNDAEKIKNYLNLVLGIVENIKNVPFEKCYCLGRVLKLVPAETMNYWRKNGCFLHTNAMENRGVTL